MQPGIVPLILSVHILGGGLALVFGYVALSAAKGAALHRRSGIVFVGAMVMMGAQRAHGGRESLEMSGGNRGGVLTFYLVTWRCIVGRRPAPLLPRAVKD